jgi:hypothetical protein
MRDQQRIFSSIILYFGFKFKKPTAVDVNKEINVRPGLITRAVSKGLALRKQVE